MKKLTSLFLSILSASVFGQVNYTYFSKSDVEQDLKFAFEKLINIHPLFLDENRTTQYQEQFSKIEETIKDSMTQNEVYLLLAPFFASINDGHTGVIVPTDQRVEFTKAGGKSFPFFVNIVDDSLYISFYCGNDSTLFLNDEQILKINGIDATEMVYKMEPLISGEIKTIKQKEIANKFRFLIWMLYGFTEDYQLVVKNNHHEIQTIKVPAVTSAEFMQNIKRMPKTNQSYYELEINQDKNTALMGIKSFGDLEGFCAFADTAFKKIKDNEIENLIIDIRNNGGGRSIVVDSLMNYLTDKSYFQYKKIETRISTELKEYYQVRYPDRLEWINSYAINDLAVSESNKTNIQNKVTRFDGNLILLTNSATFSAAATFTGVFKELNLGKIIGEETGGTISYYGDFWFLQTPNTKITFYVSPKHFVQYGGNDYYKGVIPDFPISDKNNSIIEYAYRMIEKNQQL